MSAEGQNAKWRQVCTTSDLTPEADIPGRIRHIADLSNRKSKSRHVPGSV
jgi:hypothetical protein